MKTLAAILAALVLTGLFAVTALAYCGEGEFNNILRESGDEGPVAVQEDDAIIVQADVYARESGDGSALAAPALAEEPDILTFARLWMIVF
jgi:hypothetical protein